ncbi:cell division protein FtsA, partial [Bacteroides finegoldii]
PKPEAEVLKTADMFENDQDLKEQARIARLKKEEEEREAKLAAKEAEKLRKQKEKEEKERRKKEAKPGWFTTKMKKTIEEMTNIFNEDDEMK